MKRALSLLQEACHLQLDPFLPPQRHHRPDHRVTVRSSGTGGPGALGTKVHRDKNQLRASCHASSDARFCFFKCGESASHIRNIYINIYIHYNILFYVVIIKFICRPGSPQSLCHRGPPDLKRVVVVSDVGMRAIIALRESRSSLGKLTSVDCLVAIKEAGYTAKELYRAGFTFSEFLLAECSAKQMKEAGFTAHNMRTAGFSMQQLQDAGFTAKQLKDAGFTGKEMRDAGFSLKRLKQAGRAHNERVMPCGVYTGTVSCGKLLKPAVERNWFTAKRMIVAGVSLERLKKAGFTARELTCAGFSCQELQESRFSGKQLKEAGFAATKMIVGSSLGELRDAGFTVRQLKEAGLSCAQLRNAGFAKAAERGRFLIVSPSSRSCAVCRAAGCH